MLLMRVQYGTSGTGLGDDVFTKKVSVDRKQRLTDVVTVHVFQTFNQDSHWKAEFPLESAEMCLL